MPSETIKKVSIKQSSGSYETRNLGVEGQYADISYDSNGQVIEDITASGVVVSSVKSVSKAIKDINSGKANLVNGKVPTSELPDIGGGSIEGYYNTTDGKFYEESTYETEITGATGKIYVDLTSNSMYRWDGSQYVSISSSGIEVISAEELARMWKDNGFLTMSVEGSPVDFDTTYTVDLYGEDFIVNTNSGNITVSSSDSNVLTASYLTSGETKLVRIQAVAVGNADVIINVAETADNKSLTKNLHITISNS